MKSKETLTVIPIMALVFVMVALLVQHRRHGWPFSLHHGAGAQAASPAAHTAPGTAPEAADHPRTGVDLAPGQAAAIGLRVVAVQEETITESFRAVASQFRGSTICGLARCNDTDIDRAWDALRVAASPRIHVFLATSAIHREFKLKMTPEEILATAVRRNKAEAFRVVEPLHGTCCHCCYSLR